MRCHLLVAFEFAALCGSTATAFSLDYRIDQGHDWPNEIEAYHSIQALSPVVQEFTPALGALDVVEIWTQDLGTVQSNGTGATLEVWIRDNATNGTVLGVSAPLVLPDGWNGPSRFNFTNPVWLTPEVRYAIELRVIAGDNWGVNSHGSLFPPVYPRGRYFLAGKPTDATDMWFRTGLQVAAPLVVLEPGNGLRWQGVPPLTYRVWGSVNLQDWGEVGQVTATSTNCAFSNIVFTEPHLFFKVSQP